MWKNLAIKFAEKIAGNFPKIRRTEIKNSAQIRSAEPRAQDMRGCKTHGEENVPENVPSRKFLNHTRRASGLCSGGFCAG